MEIKVFVLGRPGSGKSTAARHLNYLLRCQGYKVAHCNDYDILLEMFHADAEHRRFRPNAYNGFDAIDPIVFDEALVTLEEHIRIAASRCNALTIEFARDDYRPALQHFSSSFLRDAYFLYLDADIEICIQRVHERVARSATADDHPSYSDEIFRWYYARDNRPFIEGHLQRVFALHKTPWVITNTGSLSSFLQEVEQFAHYIFTQEQMLCVPALDSGGAGRI